MRASLAKALAHSLTGALEKSYYRHDRLPPFEARTWIGRTEKYLAAMAEGARNVTTANARGVSGSRGHGDAGQRRMPANRGAHRGRTVLFIRTPEYVRTGEHSAGGERDAFFAVLPEAIVTSMPAGVPSSVAVTAMDERIRNLMRERGQRALTHAGAVIADLADKIVAALYRYSIARRQEEQINRKIWAARVARNLQLMLAAHAGRLWLLRRARAVTPVSISSAYR